MVQWVSVVSPLRDEPGRSSPSRSGNGGSGSVTKLREVR